MNLFTVNRTLRGLENQGLVKIRRMCIEIHDSPGLSGLLMPLFLQARSCPQGLVAEPRLQ